MTGALSPHPRSIMSDRVNPPIEPVRIRQPDESQTLGDVNNSHLPSRCSVTTVPLENSSDANLGSSDVYHTKKETSTPSINFDITSITDSILQTMKKFDHKVDDHTLSIIEGLGLLYHNLCNCSDYKQVLSVSLLYLKTHCTKSLSKKLIRYLTQDMSPQAGPEDYPEWLTFLRNAKENFSQCKASSLFTHFSKLTGLLVMTGLCSSSDLTFSLKGYKMLAPRLFDRHYTAGDIFESIISTVTFFIEGAYLCFKKGSLSPFFGGDFSTTHLDEDYAKLISWWELVKCGNLKKFHGVEDCVFDNELEQLLTKIRSLMSTCQGWQKSSLNTQLIQLLKIKNAYVALKLTGGVRHAPFGIELFGPSAQGKTTCGEQLILALLTAAGLPTGPEYQATVNAADKFMSSWTTDKIVAKVDDLGNEKADFVEQAPTRMIIDMMNNERFCVLKANADEKGKCFFEAWLVVVTTNNKTLDAYVCSNCPYSVQRRMPYVLTVVAKEEYQNYLNHTATGIDSAAVWAEYPTDDEGNTICPPIDDIWEITVERAVSPGDHNLMHLATYDVLEYRGQKLERVPMSTVVNFLVEEFLKHKKMQEQLVERSRNRHVMQVCGIDGCRKIAGVCDDHVHPQSGFESCTEIQRRVSRVGMDLWRSFAITDLRRISSENLQYFVSRVPYWDPLGFIPNSIYDITIVRNFLYFKYGRRVIRSLRHFLIILFAMHVVITSFEPLFLLISIPFTMWFLVYLIHLRMQCVISELRSRNCALNYIADVNRSTLFRGALGALTIAGTMYSLHKLWKQSQSPAFVPHGNLEPKSQGDLDARDNQPNVYARVSKRPLPVSDIAHCSTVDTLSNGVAKNLVYGSIIQDTGKRAMANLLFVATGAAILPTHYFDFYGDQFEVEFFKKDPITTGGRFKAWLSREMSYQIPYTDLSLVYVSSGGSFFNLTKHFPNSNLPDHCFRMLYRKKDGCLRNFDGCAISSSTVRNGSKAPPFPGGSYGKKSTFRVSPGLFEEGQVVNTFTGMCGAVLMSDERKGVCISGIHVGGTEDTPYGCYGNITQEEICGSLLYLNTMPGVLLAGCSSAFREKQLGLQFLTKDELHIKSPLNYMPETSQFEYYGSCIGRSKSISNVRVTPISPSVIEVCGIPNKWTGPVFSPPYYGFQKCAENASEPGTGLPPDLLIPSFNDYFSGFRKLLDEQPFWKMMKPLTDSVNINGSPGVKFIDAIKISTAVGYPMTGPKTQIIIENEPTPEMPCNREFIPEIVEEIREVEQLYSEGKRAWCVAKALKKDEILDKEKCRIFYGNSVVLTFLIRKYFLPILRFVQMNPIVSECAVGVDAHGDEWEQLHTAFLKYGKERIFAGDYSKYDQKLPSQLLLASLKILINIAELCDYTPRDLTIMRSMTADIVFAVIAFDGDLIGITSGTHISGNSLTVVLNGMCGSLNLRCFFYSLFDKKEQFRDCVSIVTYGDDNGGSVRAGYEAFNIKSFSKFLATYGQQYTMPDKSTVLSEFLPYENFEFLKRKSVWHEDLDSHVGALNEDSIFKSLHMFIRDADSPGTTLTASALNMDGAIREWFNHGRTIYDHRLDQMKTIASMHGLTHRCRELEMTYDDWVAHWHDKYDPQCGDELVPRSENFWWEPIALFCCYALLILFFYSLSKGKIMVEPSNFSYSSLCSILRILLYFCQADIKGIFVSFFASLVVQPIYFYALYIYFTNFTYYMDKMEHFVHTTLLFIIKHGPSLTHKTTRAVSNLLAEPSKIWSLHWIPVGQRFVSYPCPHLGFVDLVNSPFEAALPASKNAHFVVGKGPPSIYSKCLTNTQINNNKRKYENIDSTGCECRCYCHAESCLCMHSMYHLYKPQSGNELLSMAMETSRSQNVKFSDQHGGFTATVKGGKDSTRTVTDTHDTELSNFFSRPIKITEVTWGVGGSVDSTFAPWLLYFSNPRVENRINNYNLLRANLHLKFVVNGNGFYYSRVLASYLPFAFQDSLSNTTEFWDLTQASQRPKIFIDPTSSQGGEMVIPFHSADNNSSVQTANIGILGDIWMRSLNILKHANGGTEPVTISVFAWAEDVELSVLTSMDLAGLTPQAGDEVDDANTSGVVSGPATAVAKAAGMLSMLPVIGPYATATAKAASMTAKVAGALGYCKPNVTKAPEPYRPTPISSLALTNVPDNAQKLTVDHKQELTIDPIICGYGDGDLLGINSIASRESIYGNFAWPISSSTDTLLWNTRIDPCVWSSTPDGGFVFPATAAAALPFQYWTGTLKYRFQFMCSSFHKGRVRIVYDPNQIDGTEYNLNYMKVIDLAEEQDITVEVGMGQATTLREHLKPGVSATPYGTVKLSASSTLGNGVLGVYVVNSLTSPNSVVNNDIICNVYISAGDDFEVFAPDDYFQQFVFKPQSGDEAKMSPVTTVPQKTPDAIGNETDHPVLGPSENIAVSFKVDNKTNLVYTGESIVTFRSMLKRYNKWLAIAPLDDLATEMILNANAYPLLRGNVAGAVHTRNAGTIPYTYTNTVLLHWVSYMFSGWRGSIRYKLLPVGAIGDQTWAVSRQGDGASFTFFTSPPNSLTTEREAAQQIVFQEGDIAREMSGVNGAAYTNSKVNPVLEWEVPFYSEKRFIAGKIQNHASFNNDTDTYRLQGFTTTGSTASYNELWVAAGEDFQTYIYSGLPRMYYEPAVPAI
jgi:hypothetical protein